LSCIVSGLVKKRVAGELQSVTLGHPLLDSYLQFLAARARTNTLLAVAYALKVAAERPKEDVVLVNLSGRGDKDLQTAADRLGMTL